MRPNIVSDAAEFYQGQIEIDRYDALKRNKLRMPIHLPEFEWRDNPLPLSVRLAVTNSKVAVALFVTFCVVTLGIAPVARVFGAGIFSPVTYPVVCFVCGVTAYFRFARTASVRESAWRFFLPQGVFIFSEWAFSPAIHPGWFAVPAVISVIAVGCLADQVNTHYVHWITANLRLKPEAAERRRLNWALRFKWIALATEIRKLCREARELEAAGRLDEAFAYRRRAGELSDLRWYSVGFLILPYFIVLLLCGVPTTLLLLSAFLFSFVLACWRPRTTAKLTRLISEVVIHSFVSWFSWDTQQNWVNSPGMFQDHLHSRYKRATLTIGCFVLLEATFVPSIHMWGAGEFLSAGWFWKAEYDFFSNLMLPAGMLICALLATGARPLWLQLEEVEWSEVGEDLESVGVWDAAVGRIQRSYQKLTRNHILMGFHAEYGYPVLIHKKLLCEHIHVLGGSGSGKTSRILTPLITQLIRGDDDGQAQT